MTFEIAQKKNEFWHAYWENKDERDLWKEKSLKPEEFYEVWINKGIVHTYEDIKPLTRSYK